jgi:hypothetical protein
MTRRESERKWIRHSMPSASFPQERGKQVAPNMPLLIIFLLKQSKIEREKKASFSSVDPISSSH